MNNVDSNTSMLSDAEVIGKVVTGETAIFELLIRRYNEVLYKIGRMYGFNHQDTEDLMQETHVAAFVRLSSFEGRSSYKTWVSRIMINKCIYKMKYGYYNRELNANNTLVSEAETHCGSLEMLLNKELSGIIEKAVEQLPVNLRSVFVLREIEEFSVNDTAALLDITPVNVKVRLNRAKTMMQKVVEHFYSRADIYSFNLKYCDAITKKTLHMICRVAG